MNSNKSTEMKVRKIERTSLLLRSACTGLLIFELVVAVVATVAIFAGRLTSVNFGSQSLVIANLGQGPHLLLAAIGVATAGVMFKALYHLRRLFDNYSRREIFTTDSTRQIRQFGISCILWGVINVVWAF